jgi:nitric oxide synthase oxygenase domain/subunit
MAAALDVAELGFYELHNGVRVTFWTAGARYRRASEADAQAGRIMDSGWNTSIPKISPASWRCSG